MHGTVAVADPYRWMEDDAQPELATWLAAENALTTAHLGKIAHRDALHARLDQLVRQPWLSAPSHHGAHYFWRSSDGRANQPIVMTATAADGEPIALIDPSAISPDGSLVLSGVEPSADGKLVAYGLAAGGGDWTQWRVRDVATRGDLPDALANTKYYAPAFTHDASGLYYSRFPAPPAGKELTETDHDCKVYFHRLGTPIADDAVVYERPDQPTWQFEPHVTDDGRYLVILIGDGEVGDRSQERIAVLDLATPGAKVAMLVDDFAADYVFIGGDGPALFFTTNAHAPRKRVIAIDAGALTTREVIPEGPLALEYVRLVGHQLVTAALQDAHSLVTTYDAAGKQLRVIALPGIGTAYGFGGLPDDTATYYRFTSFTSPGTVYRYDLATGASTPWRPSPSGIDPAAYETRQVFYASTDGTKVPMFITAKRGLALDGTHPALLTGYGGFGVSYTPYFDPAMVAWMERGGIFALANIRGGGEYGEAWHAAGIRRHKQTSFDDFIAAGEWLVANHYTARAHLGIIGTSGGGLLVGAVLVERPELFGAAVPIAGVLDMMRFHKFGQGAGWEGDYGSPDDPADFAALRAYSPVHNVRPGAHYPPTLVITSDHDVRVAPLHSYKLAAALQAAQGGDAPILLRVQTISGHGGGTTLAQRIDQETEILAFLANALGLAL